MTLAIAAAQRTGAWGTGYGRAYVATVDDSYDRGWVKSPWGSLYNPKVHYVSPAGSLEFLNDDGTVPSAGQQSVTYYFAPGDDGQNREVSKAVYEDGGRTPVPYEPARIPPPIPGITPVQLPLPATPFGNPPGTRTLPAVLDAIGLNANRPVSAPGTYLKAGTLVDENDVPISTAKEKLQPMTSVEEWTAANWRKYIPYAVGLLVLLLIAYAIRSRGNRASA